MTNPWTSSSSSTSNQPHRPRRPTSAALQAGALRPATTAPSPTVAPDEGLFTLPGTDPSTGR